MAIHYIIVDDELPGRMNLRLAMENHPDWILARECDGVEAARSAVASGKVDVVFLDIQMPRQSGLILAREISCLSEPPLIIFVTAYSEHALDAFEVHALDYLLKPVDDARLAQTVERAAAMLGQRERQRHGAALRRFVDADNAESAKYISVRSVGRIEQIRISDILRIESAGNYVELRLATRTVLHRMALSHIERLLPADDFVRVHRGSIVQRDQIASLETTGDGTYRLMLRCGDAVAVSERYAGALKLVM